MTRRPLHGLFLSCALLCIAGRVGAQDAPRVGLTMGYPTAVGVIWNVSPRAAVRPEVTISGATGDSSGADFSGPSPAFTNDSWTLGTGASALFYLSGHDALRTYVSPRFIYSRTSNTTKSPSAVVSSISEGTSTSYATSGSFGAEYLLGRRFGVFGEVGLVYTSTSASATSTLETTIISTTATTTVRSDTHSKTWGPRSAVGVIFYF